MNKAEFIERLHSRLVHLPSDEADKSISFYSGSIDDRIEDGMSEEAAVAALGNMDDIVQNIETDMPLSTLVKTRIRSSREKSGNKKLWMILAICGFPLWFPLGVAFAAVLFAFYLCIWTLILCFYTALLALAVGAVGCFIIGIIRGFAYSPSLGVMLVGLSTSCLGLLLVCYQPVNMMVKSIISFTKHFIKWVKGLFIAEKGVF